MKKLNLKHAMTAAKIIKEANLKKELGNILEEANAQNANKTRVGMNAAMVIIEACANENVEKQLYTLLDDVFETKSEEMSLEALIENTKQLAKENNLTAFFNSAGALTKK